MEYTIKRSNRKTLCIAIERDRRVVVQAPFSLSDSDIDRLVEKKRDLILKKINNPQKYPQHPQPKEFVSGEGMMFLGKLYRLEIVDDLDTELEFDNIFRISRHNQSKAHTVFKEWYRRQAENIISPIAEKFAKQLGVRFNQCKVSEMKYRWGSCTVSGNLNFNWRIIKAPVSVINYIIVHELAHLREANHTPEFWNIVSIQEPHYQQAKQWLKDHGNQLEIDF